jgi:uncharacterized membrane protein YedE/YeeE
MSRRNAMALLSGAVFSAGLCISGMTRPSKVLGFLDFFGAWDPSLALVMVGAIGVAAVAFRVSARRGAPLLDTEYRVPPAGGPVSVDLVVGAAIFGIGWGLSGLCPGPAVTSLASGHVGPVVFVAAMLGGMAVSGWLRSASRPSAQDGEGTARVARTH